MLLQITDLESFADAVSVARMGSTTLMTAMIFSVLLVAITFYGMLKRDERIVHIARRSQYLLTGFLILAVAILYMMIFNGHYTAQYVYHVAENQEEIAYKITGLWASQQGSLLFWALILSLCGSAFAFTNRHSRTDRRLPATLLTLFVIEAFFIYLMMFDRSNPFTLTFAWLNYDHISPLTVAEYFQQMNLPEGQFSREGIDGLFHGLLIDARNLDPSGEIAQMKMGAIHESLLNGGKSLPTVLQNAVVSASADGKGMNPQLHNYWLAIHPPTLYFGYIGFTIPFCLGVGSLISGELDSEWIRRARLWTMVSWTFLTAGIAMGGLWAYEILGWGGYWAWDPVENASFIPWLTATAFIHSVVVQERRGMLKVWNVALIILTYTLTIIGTFLVRSGIITSVHAFGDAGLVTPLVVFMIVVFLGSILLIVWRLPLLQADRKLRSIFSREGTFLINNLVLCLIALATLTMTLWPVITRFLFGVEGKHEFGQEAFVLVNLPLFLTLLTLTGIGPLLPYGKASGREALRQFAIPLAFSGLIFLINAAVIFQGNYQRSVVSDGTSVAYLVSLLRIGTQFGLPSICAMILGSVIQEAFVAGHLRQRTTKTNIMTATFGAVFNNRRRFGGYTCHIGIAIVAMGIYISSFYEVDTSAQVPQGGYALIGDGEEALAFVADNSDDSEIYRELIVSLEAERNLEGNLKNSQGQESRAVSLWRERHNNFNGFREQLQMAHQLRLDPSLSIEGYVAKRFTTVEHLFGSLHDRMVDEKRKEPFLNAVATFSRDPNFDAKAILKRMAGTPNAAVMAESFGLARVVAQNPEAFDFLSFLGQAGDAIPATLNAAIAGFYTDYAKKVESQWERAQKISKGGVSFEYIRSTVRIFEINVTPLSDEKSATFNDAFGLAYLVYKQSLQDLVGTRRAEADDFDRAAGVAASSQEFATLRDYCAEIGPVFIQILKDAEKAAKTNLSMARAFTKRLRVEVFAADRQSVIQAVSMIIDPSSYKTTEAAAREEANALISKLGFRALGGLRFIESLKEKIDFDDEPAETTGDENAEDSLSLESGPSESAEEVAEERKEIQRQRDVARAYVKEKIAEIIAGAIKLDPQIKMFYDKRTGSPRSMGESVRDPEIARQLTRDLYVILQDADVKESFFNNDGRDTFNYRIFVKPGMNLGLLGLLIMIFGSVFALLPASRKGGRVRVKATKGAK